MIGIILSHSSIACKEQNIIDYLNSFKKEKTSTDRLVKLDLPVRELTQGVLHLCLLCVLEYCLLAKCGVVESIRCLVRCCDRVL